MPQQMQNTDETRLVLSAFLRKYIHARIGGYITGHASRRAELKGSRNKGGGTLREKLTHVVGKKKNRSRRSSSNSSAGF